MKRCYTEAFRIFFSESGEKRQVMTLNDLSKKRKKSIGNFGNKNAKRGQSLYECKSQRRSAKTYCENTKVKK